METKTLHVSCRRALLGHVHKMIRARGEHAGSVRDRPFNQGQGPREFLKSLWSALLSFFHVSNLSSMLTSFHLRTTRFFFSMGTERNSQQMSTCRIKMPIVVSLQWNHRNRIYCGASDHLLKSLAKFPSLRDHHSPNKLNQQQLIRV